MAERLPGDSLLAFDEETIATQSPSTTVSVWMLDWEVFGLEGAGEGLEVLDWPSLPEAGVLEEREGEEKEPMVGLAIISWGYWCGA